MAREVKKKSTLSSAQLYLWAFFSSVEFTAVESIFKGDAKDPFSDPIAHLLENWLEEYSKDENRYTGRGAHLSLKRAEKARAMVNKFPNEEVQLRQPLEMIWRSSRGGALQKCDGEKSIG